MIEVKLRLHLMVQGTIKKKPQKTTVRCPSQKWRFVNKDLENIFLSIIIFY